MPQFICSKMNGFKGFPIKKPQPCVGLLHILVGGLEEILSPHFRLPTVGNCHTLKILDRAIFGISLLVSRPTTIMQFPSFVGFLCFS